jgi:hypothetical protein
MLDEREGEVPAEELHLAFNRKPVLQRIAVVIAGPLASGQCRTAGQPGAGGSGLLVPVPFR